MGKAAKRKILQKIKSNPLACKEAELKPNENLVFIPKVLELMESIAQMPATVYSLSRSGLLLYSEIVSYSLSKVKVAENDLEKEKWLSFPNKCIENAIALHLLWQKSEKSTDDYSVIPEIRLKHGIQLAKWGIDNNHWIPPIKNWLLDSLSLDSDFDGDYLFNADNYDATIGAIKPHEQKADGTLSVLSPDKRG